MTTARSGSSPGRSSTTDSRGLHHLAAPALLALRRHGAPTPRPSSCSPSRAFTVTPAPRGGFLGPLYGWGSRTAGRLGRRHRADPPVRPLGRPSNQVVLPLFVRWGDDRERPRRPWWGRFRRGPPDGWDAGVFPFLFFGRRAATSYASCRRSSGHKRGRRARPTWWARSTSSAAPTAGRPAWRRSSSSASTTVARTRSSRRSCSRTRGSARAPEPLVGPFFHGRDGDQTVDALFPLVLPAPPPHRGAASGPWPAGSATQTANTIVVGPYGTSATKALHSRTHFLFPLGAVHESPDYKVRCSSRSSGACTRARRPTPPSSRSTAAVARPARL